MYIYYVNVTTRMWIRVFQDSLYITHYGTNQVQKSGSYKLEVTACVARKTTPFVGVE